MDERKTFSTQDRLCKRREFLRVYQRGDRIHSRSFVLYILPKTTGRHRLGLTVSRRIGASTVRNRIKRRLREIFRNRRQELGAACDVVVNTRKVAAKTPFGGLEREFRRAITRWKKQGRQD